MDCLIQSVTCHLFMKISEKFTIKVNHTPHFFSVAMYSTFALNGPKTCAFALYK